MKYLEYMMAVSYTHLDVYKRQIVDSTVLPTITQRIKDMFDYAG